MKCLKNGRRKKRKTMKNKLYILYDYYYPALGGGSVNYPVSFCIGTSYDVAVWQFKLMGFSELLERNNLAGKVEEVEPFDEIGFMYVVPEHLLPY